MKKLYITLFLSLAMLSPIQAANWKTLQEGNNTNTIKEQIDVDSIQSIDYDTRKAWIKITNNNTEEKILLAFTKDGQLKMLDCTNNQNPPTFTTNWEYVEPDTLGEKAYNIVWPKKERKVKSQHVPNRWEQKGEDTINNASDRIINKILNKIDWGWGW